MQTSDMCGALDKEGGGEGGLLVERTVSRQRTSSLLTLGVTVSITFGDEPGPLCEIL